MVAIAPPRSRVVGAACFAVVGAALLGVQLAGVFSFVPPAGPGVFTLVVGVFGALVAGTAIAAALVVLRAPKLARMLVLLALAGSVFVEPLLGAPPRGFPVPPLAIAAGLMVVAPSLDRTNGLPYRRSGWVLVLGWLGVILHVVVGLLYPAAGLLAPTYALIFLSGIWALLLLLAFRLLRDSPILTPLVPLAAIGVWYGVVYLGGVYLGWTA